jgi:hypothetical protein
VFWGVWMFGSAVLYPICWLFCNASYLALVCVHSMLVLTSATPGMPYADIRSRGISPPGRSLSRVIPAVRSIRRVRMQVALHTHVRSPVALREHVCTHTVVALSTHEAEYVTCSCATWETIWMRWLSNDITTKGLYSKNGTQIGCDNQGALKVLDTGIIQAKT